MVKKFSYKCADCEYHSCTLTCLKSNLCDGNCIANGKNKFCYKTIKDCMNFKEFDWRKNAK